MGKYYDFIMNPSKDTFTDLFNILWSKELDKLKIPYSNAIQLRIGNQLRPKLTCWGAAINTNNESEIDLERTAKIAVYIEMLHKASIIIDDMVDCDDARHGRQSFHIEFGREKAVIFSLVLLGQGMSGICEMFYNTPYLYRSLLTYSGTISRMATGCLEELELDSKSRYDLEKIQRIINYETISLIKNSLLLGYWSNKEGEDDLEPIILEIGNNCGYIFQILNDLEPFSSLEKNSNYKGGINFDVNRNRKNIAVAYIFGSATSKEKHQLLSQTGMDLQALIWALYEKYDVYNAVCQDARNLERQTYKLVERLYGTSHQTNCLDDFSRFIEEMMKICFSRLK